MTTKQTKQSACNAVRALVDQSVTRDEIVTAEVTHGEMDAALERASGSCNLVAQYGYVDVWGGPDRRPWRLHLTAA